MTRNYTVWNPDTCDCEVRYYYDTNDPTATTAVDIVKNACPYHANLLPNVPVTYSCIQDEGHKKNTTFQAALDNLTSDIGTVFTNDDGTTEVRLKNGIYFKFNYSGTSPNRVLHVWFIGVTLSQQKKQIWQTKADQLFGAGNVVVE